METSKKRHLFGNAIWSFIVLTLFVMILSLIGNALGWQDSYIRINATTGATEKVFVAVSNLFSFNELRNIIGNAMANFVTFAPLGSFLIALIGVGVSYKSGLLNVLFTKIGRNFSKFWMTFAVVLLAILSNFANDLGYVLLIPLVAIMYLVNNRNPIGGMAAAFVGVASGQGVNFLLSSVGYGLTPYTELAAKLTDDTYDVGRSNNIFFCIVCTIALAFLITYITEKIVLPRIPKYKKEEEFVEEIVIGRKEKRGLVLATIGSCILLITFIYMLIPGLPLSGLLLDDSGKTYLDMIFGSNSYFSSSIVYLLSSILLIAGILYGFRAKTIRGKEQITLAIYDSLNSIGSILILIFMASQFISIFKRSNLGTIFSIWLIDGIKALNFTSIPLILLVILFIAISNLFLTSSMTKWTMASPVLVPLFMNSNMTPEFTQAVFRVSESATNILTPMFAYFIIFMGYMEMYNKGDRTVSFGSCYKVLWPYSIAITLLWIFILVTWYIIGLPIGFNIYPTV